jgi:hypothetical protein
VYTNVDNDLPSQNLYKISCSKSIGKSYNNEIKRDGATNDENNDAIASAQVVSYVVLANGTGSSSTTGVL